MRTFYGSGWIYDCGLEPLLLEMKKKVAQIIWKNELLPALDICCGTGTQCQKVAQKDSRIFGLDKDFKMIRYASSKLPGVFFLCGDAAHIPFRASAFRGIVISYALHDKPPETRLRMLKEANRILTSEGKLILVDFEQPWNIRSRWGWVFTTLIERMAGKEHFRNGRHFLETGGLTAFLRKNNFEIITRYDIELAHTSIVMVQFAQS